MAYNMKEIIIMVSVLILCIMLVRRICRGKIGSRFQYALWLLVALRLVIPVSIPINLPAVELIERYQLLGLHTDQMVEQLEQPIQVTVDSRSGIYHLLEDEDNQIKDAAAAQSDGPTIFFMVGHLRYSWIDVLGMIWTGGMIITVAWIIITNVIFSRRLKKERKVMELSEEAASVLRERLPQQIAGMYDRVTVYITEGLVSPCLYGLPGREAVYLSPDIAKDTDRLCHVLTHEFCHKKHSDSFWGILREILVTVYWFHPLVWAAAVLSKRDCELACDEAALLLLGETERISYGETLLSIITRKARVFDLFCNATTMTGSGKSVRERISFIAKKPKVLRMAVLLTAVVMVVVFAFAFTRSHENVRIIAFGPDTDTVTGADMQIPLPESIRGICGQVMENGKDDIVIYHVESRREVGRFARMSLKDTLQLVDEGRQVVPIGDYGDNYFLKAYLGISPEPVSVTEHTYTPYSSGEEESGRDAGALWHEDIIIHDDSYEAEGVPGTDSSAETEHIYVPGTDSNTETEHIYVPGTDSNTETEHIYVPGTDSNTKTEYIIVPEENNSTQIPSPEESESYTIFLPFEEGQSLEAMELAEENESEEAVEYLPNEEIITTTTYPAKEVNIDVLSHKGCFVYIKADYGKVEDRYLQEMESISDALEKASADVIVLSLNGEIREELLNTLTENRTPYVGDNVKVSALVNALPVPSTFNFKGDISLQTVEKPYSVRFEYEMTTSSIPQEDLDMIYFNAAMLFYAIGNVEEVAIYVRQPSDAELAASMHVYKRADMEEIFGGLLKADYENEELFHQGLSELHAAVVEYLHAKE